MKEKTVHLWNGRIEEIECGQKVKNPVVLTILLGDVTCKKCKSHYEKYKDNFKIFNKKIGKLKNVTDSDQEQLNGIGFMD